MIYAHLLQLEIKMIHDCKTSMKLYWIKDVLYCIPFTLWCHMVIFSWFWMFLHFVDYQNPPQKAEKIHILTDYGKAIKYLTFRIQNFRNMPLVPCHHGMRCSQDWDVGNSLQLCRVAVNILNKQSWTANKLWSSSYGLGMRLTAPCNKK
jgi:hypothetical protein